MDVQEAEVAGVWGEAQVTDIYYVTQISQISQILLSHRNHGNHGNFYSKELRNKGMDRLLMDDSHRDDCLILVENKGLILLEEC